MCATLQRRGWGYARLYALVLWDSKLRGSAIDDGIYLFSRVAGNPIQAQWCLGNLARGGFRGTNGKSIDGSHNNEQSAFREGRGLFQLPGRKMG